MVFLIGTVLSSPFTGDHSEAKHILRDDGSVTIRMDPHPAPYNKNAHMINRSVNSKPNDHLPIINRLKLQIFGKNESEIKFE